VAAAEDRIRLDPHDPIGHVLAAGAFLRQKDYDAANRSLAAAESTSGTNLQSQQSAKYLRALVHLAAGEFSDASKALYDLNSNKPDQKALRLLKRLVECGVSPEQPYVLYLDVGRSSNMITQATYDTLLPGPIRHNPQSLVNDEYIDRLIQDEISGMSIGNVARSKTFMTDLLEVHSIDLNAFNSSTGAR
jgi:hypothetical protein